ncbi:hypothetical protein NQ315_012772 [Exocentrus adspersus]|uniref:Uncharacterized protein n=1 Tax=Exocentrus adspersus TaxID=1586481 RepID=A0AAV8VD30_9CUCU|nr:hypothetical protein NQ315_012772 [Exocentrus adspersus]
MSKTRNRSVKILPHNFSSLLQKLSENSNDENNAHVDYFGENIKDVNIRSPYTPLLNEAAENIFCNTNCNSEVDSITLDLNKLSGLSSSSSLSWSDEYESEISKKVLEELERMDRVLRREEPIPPYYDRDEYEQWMNTFPNISIFDNHLTPVNSTHNIRKLDQEDRDRDRELIIYGTDKQNVLNKDCDVTSVNNNKKKSAVINLSDSPSNKLFNQKSTNTARKRKLEENRNKNKNIFTISHKPQSLDTDKYLKISPLKNNFTERRLSSKSLLNRDFNKEFGETTVLEYNSLPFIKVDEPEVSKRNLQGTKNFTLELFGKNEGNNLVLPPIVTPNQFRSISATPRKGTKTFSALSMKLEGNFKNQNRSGKGCVKFLDNPVSNR